MREVLVAYTVRLYEKYTPSPLIDMAIVEKDVDAFLSTYKEQDGEKEWDVDFHGHFKARLRFENGKLSVIAAMNGYGDGEDVSKIIVTPLPPPPSTNKQ